MSKKANEKILTSDGKKCNIINKKERRINIYNQIKTVQQWMPFKEILEEGIIQLKDNSFIKIIKVAPINFNLKSNFEKEAILNSYKIFLKTCNFNIQILIQSNKEDLSKHIFNLKRTNKDETENLKKINNKYINYIKEINKQKKSSSKNFYILIKEIPEKNKKIDINNKKIICEKLNDNYFKIKECLTRCGNIVIDFSEKIDIEKILYSFLNTRKDLMEI